MMVTIDPSERSARDNYKLLSGSVIPRPIAFVTTLSSDGVLNAAPYSYFNIVSSNPPLLSVSVQRKQGGQQKDTARNAIEAGAFVVHIADQSYIEQLNETAANLPPEESEVTAAGLTPVPSVRIAVPGVAEAKIRMECVLEKAIPLGGTDDAPACDLLIGKVVFYHLDETVYDERGYIDSSRLAPIARLAGSDYAGLGERFSIDRPTL